MEERGAVEESFQVSLAAHTDRTRDLLRRLIADLPFEDVAAGEVDAIKFEYDWPSFVPVACPLNRRHGHQGDVQELDVLAPGEASVFDRERVDRYIDALPEDDQDCVRDELDWAQMAQYETWFRACWAAVRGARPGLRGFIAIHDSSRVTDLDTGEELREDSPGVIEAWTARRGDRE